MTKDKGLVLQNEQWWRDGYNLSMYNHTKGSREAAFGVQIARAYAP